MARLPVPVFGVRPLLVLSGLAGCGDATPPELSAPARLEVVSGQEQQVVNGPAAAPNPLVVRLVDPKDRPVSGATVTWTASDPTAALSAASVITDAGGTARVEWTLGTSAGVQTVTATSPGLGNSAAVFTGRNTVLAITGGVTIAAGLPLALSAGALPRTPDRGPIRSSIGAPAPPEPGSGSRRVVVQFRAADPAAARAVATEGAALSRSLQTMRQTVAPLLGSGLVARMEASPAILATRLTLPDEAPLAEVLSLLRADARVQWAMVDEQVPMLDALAATELAAAAPATLVRGPGSPGALARLLPNEQLLVQTLWHYNMVDAPRAWATVTGSRDVLVAVVDDGIRFDHPAIAANLTSDGYNFVVGGDRLESPMPLCAGGTTLLPEPGYGPDPTAHDNLSWTGNCWERLVVGGHGLHVAGTIGAAGNDGIGTAGINWTVSIRPVRVLDTTGSGSWFDVAQGVLYAAGLPASDGQGGTVTAPAAARIINMSIGAPGGAEVLRNAIAAASAAGSLVVAAAGNSQSSAPIYPAAYPEVVSVVALGPDFQLASYTNIGPGVSLSAPGGNFRSAGTAGVASTTWNFQTMTPNYAYYSGTSMAAPHVAGVAALVLAANPGLSNAQLRLRLESTAVPLGASGRDPRFGYGVVNAHRAVNNIVAPTPGRFVRVHDTVTGEAVRTVQTDASGAFSVSHLPAGRYHVVAGEDDGGDGGIGMRGRRFGWFGDGRGPAVVEIDAGSRSTGAAPILIGLPREAKPNHTLELANRLLVDGYVAGQINATHPQAYFAIPIPTAGTYTFETAGVLGSCGFGIELDTSLTLFDPAGVPLAVNADTPMEDSMFCSRISMQLDPGLYHVRVQGVGAATGQFVLSVRR
jgi:subtilisin family serine protease